MGGLGCGSGGVVRGGVRRWLVWWPWVCVMVGLLWGVCGVAVWGGRGGGRRWWVEGQLGWWGGMWELVFLCPCVRRCLRESEVGVAETRFEVGSAI